MLQRRIVLSLLAAPVLLAGCDGEASGPMQVRENAFTWSGPGAAGRTLTIRDFSGSIEVRPSADDTVRVTARLEWRGGDPDRDVSFSGGSTPGGVLICAVWGDGRCTASDYTANIKSRRGANRKVHFVAEVPAGMKLVLSNIDGSLTAAATAPVVAKTMNGDVRVVTAVGPVQGETLNGSVDIRMSSLVGTDSVIAKTLNGQVFIYLPSVEDATIDLDIGNGRVMSEFPEEAPIEWARKDVRATVGTGARVIRGSVLNGELALRKLDAQGRAP